VTSLNITGERNYFVGAAASLAAFIPAIAARVLVFCAFPESAEQIFSIRNRGIVCFSKGGG